MHQRDDARPPQTVAHGPDKEAYCSYWKKEDPISHESFFKALIQMKLQATSNIWRYFPTTTLNLRPEPSSSSFIKPWEVTLHFLTSKLLMQLWPNYDNYKDI
jgi:hypothetical protein